MLTGKELRNFRLSLDLTLRNVERETYISKKWLIRIESEQHVSMKLQRYLELFYEDKKRKILLAALAAEASDADFDENYVR